MTLDELVGENREILKGDKIMYLYVKQQKPLDCQALLHDIQISSVLSYFLLCCIDPLHIIQFIALHISFRSSTLCR